MNARWRTVLRMRALLRLLLDEHVPLGALYRCVEQVRDIDDAHLPNEQRVHAFTRQGSLALDIVNELLGDDVELIDRDTPSAADRETWHGQREKWRDLIEHLRERRRAAGSQAQGSLGADEARAVARELDELMSWLGTVQPDPRPPGEPRDLLRIGDELRRRRAAAQRFKCEAAVVNELDELLAFVLPLMGAPLPDVERFEAYLESDGFYNVMQAYRHASAAQQTEATAAFEAVKAILIAQVRR